MDRVLVLLAVLLVTGVASVWWRSRDGRVVTTERWGGLPPEAGDIAAVVNSETPLTLVEFTAPDCAPCVQTKALLERAVNGRDDVSIALLDVGDVLDLVRAHRIMRAPTTMLISSDGHLLGRVSGVPREDELAALLNA